MNREIQKFIPKTALGITAFVSVFLVVGTAALAPLFLADAASSIDTKAILQPSSPSHWFGTDNLGRDILARVLYASRLSLLLALGATSIAAVIGIVIGALPSVLGRSAARAVTAALNMAVAFPGLLLVLFLSVIFGVGSGGAMLAVGLAMVPGFARITQTMAASVAGQDYVSAARLMGVGKARVLSRYVIPNIAEPLIVNISLTIGQALLVFSSLSFLGLGVQSPDYDWGQMLNEGLGRIYSSPAAALAPGVAVMIAGLSFNLAGDSMAKSAGLRRFSKIKGMTAPALARIQHDEVGDAGRDAALLNIRNLEVFFPSNNEAGVVRVVAGVDLSIQAGEIVGIVGESGSGKSLTAAAAVKMLPYPAVATAETLVFDGMEIQGSVSPAMRHHLGSGISMIFQDPMNALNPALKIGRQITEAPEVHSGLTKPRAAKLAVDLLTALHVTSPDKRARQYPHEFSGGMRQRSVIAMGLAPTPKLIVADEPTTALDVTVQKQTLQILKQAQNDTGAAILFISHDLAVVTQLCDRVLVMYAGRVVEELPAASLATDATHPYTKALLASSPDMASDRSAPLATIPGRPPLPGTVEKGCPFADRCAFATSECFTDNPPLVQIGHGQQVSCFHPQVQTGRLTDREELSA